MVYIKKNNFFKNKEVILDYLSGHSAIRDP